jgi:hypothetical protein
VDGKWESKLVKYFVSKHASHVSINPKLLHDEFAATLQSRTKMCFAEPLQL